MRAVQFNSYGARPAVVEVPAPRCAPDGVVIEVRATGLCRSDWHAWRGHEEVALPHIPGHELAGVVAAVGQEVESWSPGQRVTVPFVLGCGRCEQCISGDAQVCPNQLQPGFTGPGSFAEQVGIERADFNLVALPDGIDFVAAASLGCRFATAFRALTVHGGVVPGQWVAVFGCGGVGLSAVMIATALGARVVAVDAAAVALARAGSLGAVALVDAASTRILRRWCVSSPVAERTCPWTPPGARRPRSRQCERCAGAAATSRSGCCTDPKPRPRCPWTR